MLHWSFFLALLGTVALQASAINLRTMCNGYSSGTLLPNPQDCNSYYVCQSGPQLAYCDYGLHFDRVHKVCNWPDWANCKLEEVDDDNLIVDLVEGLPEEEDLTEPFKPEPSEDKPTEEHKESIQSESGEEKLEVKPDQNEDKPAADLKEPIQSEPGEENLKVKPDLNGDKPTEELKEPTQPDTSTENLEGKPDLGEDKPKDPENPLHSQHSKELLSENSEEIKSNGVGQLIASSVSKDPNSKDKTPVEEETDHVLAVNVPIASSDDTKDLPYVIKVPVVVPAQNADFGTASDPKPSSNSTLAIQVPIVLPTEIANPEGFQGSEPSTNFTQVVPVPIDVPGDIPNSPLGEIVDETSNPIEQVPESEDKVEASNSSKDQPQIIELAAPVLPVHILTPNEDIAATSSEKVDTPKPLQSTNQVIELPVPANPVVIPNTNIDNSRPAQVEVAVEKIEKPTDPQPVKNPTQVIDLPVYAGPDMVMPVPRPEVGKVDSWTSVKEHQDISISSSEENLNPAKETENLSLSSSEEDLSSSSESVQSSEEDLKVPEPSVASDSKSSEEEPIQEVEKVEIIHDKDQVSPDSAQSSEESIEAATNHKGSPESSEENILKPGQSTDAQEYNAASNSIESLEEAQGNVNKVQVSTDKVSGESVNKPNHQKVDSEEHKGSPESSEENVLKPDDNNGSQEHNALPDSIESAEADVLIPIHHIHPGYNIWNKVELSADPQTDKVATHTSEEALLNQHNEPSSESLEDILHHLPTPLDGHEHDKPLAPIGSPITPEAEANLTPYHSNLIVSILSVASFQGNSSANATINRPIVGAHSTETGHPIDVMTGYSSKNVQCIHNGLYFLPHPSSCQKYFICAYHHLHLHSCGNYLIWNYKRERCEVGSDSRCYSRERVLEERPRPQKPSKSDSEEQVAEIVPVTDAPVTATAMPPLRTTQATEPTANRDSMVPKCTTLRQVYMPSYDNCNRYYICILGKPVLTSCPDNMHWDAKGEFCGNPTEAKCVQE